MEVLGTLFQFGTISFILIGSILGLFIGALPGLTATMGIAILTPLTFWLPPEHGLAMLISIYCTGIFASGIPAILINTPGTPASMATTFDGYPLTKNGQAGKALGINAIYSGLGGLVSTIFLILLAQPISNFALSFSAPEYFALAIFGLSMMIGISGKSLTKGLLTGFIGLFIATIGLDPIVSTPRFTFDQSFLFDGISFIPIMIGLFGLGEIFDQVLSKPDKIEKIKTKIGKVLPSRKEHKDMAGTFTMSSIVSTFIGAIPGAGGDIASIITWDQAKRFSNKEKKKEFNQGSIRGLAATCTANNGVIGGAFTTMLTLGLPGDAVTAILIGSLMMYGLQPGPNLFVENPDIVHTIFGLLLVSNIVVILIGLLGAQLFSRIMLLKQEFIWIAVVLFSIVGAYSLNNSVFDVWVMLISGVIGLIFRKLDYPLGPLILGLILGPMAESNFRRAMTLSQEQSYLIFVTNPISLILLLLAAISLLFPLIRIFIKKNA